MHPVQFGRPSAYLWTAPTGQVFLLAALEGPKSSCASFFEVTVSHEGRLATRPHMAVTWDGDGSVGDFDRVVRCFLPDLSRRDGSYDFVLGGSGGNSQPTVRVIEDFLPPRPRRL